MACRPDAHPPPLALMLAGIGGLLLVVASSSSLWDRDEPRFGRAAVEMVETGDYLVPRFNGGLRPDKPPLVYWAMAPFVGVLGATALAVRLPSVLAMVGACFFTFLIGRRMFSPRVGRWAAVMLGTSAMAMWIGSAATADAVLNLCLIACLWVVVERVYKGPARWQWPALAGALGLAQLAKGPVALAVVGLTVVALGWFLRRQAGAGLWEPGPDRGHRSRLWGRWFWSAALAGVGIFAAWGLPAAVATDWQLVREGLGKHVFDRAVSASEGHGAASVLTYLATIPLYVPLTIAGFFPWTLMLPAALSALGRKRLGGAAAGRERAVLWAWILPTFALMSLVVTKLPHYVFPVYPALAIASAAVLVQRVERPDTLGEKDRDWLRGGVWFFGPVAVGGAVAAAVACAVLFGVGDAVKAGAWAVAGLVLAVWLIRLQLKEDVARAGRVAAVGVPAVVLLALVLVLPAVERGLKPSPALAAVAEEAGGRGADVAAVGYEEGSLVFYLDRPPSRPVRFGVDVAAWAAEPGPGALIVTAARLAEAERAHGPLGLAVIGRAPVVNYSSHGRRMEVLVARRGGQAGATEGSPGG